MIQTIKQGAKRITYFIMVAVLLTTILPARTHVYASQVRLIIDNREVSGLDTPPVILENRVMVPARAVFEQVGGRVEWNELDRQITVYYGDDVLIMRIGNTAALLNGMYIRMELPPTIIGDRTLIPLRFPAEAFGFDVAWDPVGRAAILHSPFEDDPANPTPPPEPDTHEVDPTPPPIIEAPGLSRDISSVPITPVPHPATNIIDLLSPRETGADAYAIIASSPITDVNHFLMPDNRLVVDIYNAVSSLSGPFTAAGPVRAVRSSQFSRTPYITRVVFEIIGASDFSLALSYDRYTLTVAFAVNDISMIIPNSTAHSDTLLIQGDFQPSIRLSSSGFPNYMTVYIDNAYMSAPSATIQGGIFSTNFSTGQIPDGPAFVRIYMTSQWPAVSLAHGRDSIAITLHQGLTGVRYDFMTRELRLSRDVVTLDLSQVAYTEEYLLNRYSFTLPHGASGLGLGSLYVGDGSINSITLRQNLAGHTVIEFETARVMAFTIHTTEAYYIIRGNRPQDIYSFIVVIDPGHGGRDPGAGHHGIRESDLVLTVSHMVMEYLNANPNIRAYMTRHTDVTVANSWRAAFANQMADLYVSVHANAVSGRPTVSGIETLYMNHSRETHFTSRQFARLLQYEMIGATGAIDRGLRPRQNLIVLRDTHMPAALVELGFLTNQAEAARLATAYHQRLLAQAIYDGIVRAYQAYAPPR